MGKNLTTFDEALLNTTKGRGNTYGDDVQKDILYQPWAKTYAKTIDEFYVDFIAPRLPNPDIVLQWHDVIEYYSNHPKAIFPVRAGNTKTRLRRGWMARVNESFSYMFTDNDFAVYIYKMALDGFCPDKDEFVKYMTEFKDPSDIGWLKGNETKISHGIDARHGVARKFLQMPARFNRAGGAGVDALETQRNVYINMGPAPTCCLGKYNYKHAHIIDVAGKDYEIPGKGNLIPWESIKDSLLGEVDDYCWDTSISNYVWKRAMPNAEAQDLKTLLIAHLFRFLDPLNHFLAPMSEQNRFVKANGMRAMDIAEYENLQKYIIKKKSSIFAGTYADFLEKTCAPQKWCAMNWADDGSEVIDLVYHEKSLIHTTYGPTLNRNYMAAIPKPTSGKSTTTKRAASLPARSKNTTATSSNKVKRKGLAELEAEYTRDKLIEVAAFYLRNKIGLKAIEKQLHLTENLGFEAQNILNVLGINTSSNSPHKGLLNKPGVNIDDEIVNATDPDFKRTLEEIKKSGL